MEKLMYIERFEKWIDDRVKDGTFPSREEALRVLAYYAWEAKEWYKALIGARIIVKEKPVTLEKVLDTDGEIFDVQKERKGWLYDFLAPLMKGSDCDKYRIKIYDENDKLIATKDGHSIEEVLNSDELTKAIEKKPGEVWYGIYCVKDGKEQKLYRVSAEKAKE